MKFYVNSFYRTRVIAIWKSATQKVWQADRQTDGRTDGQTDDGEVIPMCHLCLEAGDTIKEHNSVLNAHRVMDLGQIVANVMVNKYVKLQWGSLTYGEVMAKNKVFDKYTNNANDNPDNDTRVMTITRLVFFEKQTS